MEDGTVYPGLAWELEYTGPPTVRPTYLVGAIYKHRAAVESMRWVIMSVGRDVNDAADGDWDAARRCAPSLSDKQAMSAVVLVCVDTSHLLTTEDGTPTDGVTATVLSVEGEWMCWADAFRWCVKGRTNLQDAVEAATVALSDCRSKRKRNPGPADPFSGDETAADKQRREASQEQTTAPVAAMKRRALSKGYWECDDCNAMNDPVLIACAGCGLGRGEPKPTTNLTLTDELLAELLNMQAEHDRTCLNCGHKWRAAPPAFCPSCNCPTSEVNLDS